MEVKKVSHEHEMQMACFRRSAVGRRIMLAESNNGQRLEGQRGGNYRVIVPEELVDDRDMVAVDRIEVIDLKPVAKIQEQ